jgi:predicted P-loop ATPase
VWDGTPRIDNWLTEYAGAEETPFNRAAGKIFLVAGVRRIRQPGCKFDTMVIWESETQGKDKSQAARILAVRDEWFTDNLPLGAEPKEVIEQISGTWIVEFGELKELSRRDREQIITFLSRQEDKARPAYGRRRETIKRQFVCIGTTNDTEYLPRDERRMWPVRIAQFDLDTLSRDVGQLWAEAAHYEEQGESITLQKDLWGAAEEARAEWLFENPYQAALAERFGRDERMSAELVWSHLGIPREHQSKAHRQVGAALRVLGFARKQCRGDGVPLKALNRGDYYYDKRSL